MRVTSRLIHGLGDRLCTLTRQDLIADQLVLQLPALLCSFHLPLQLIVRAVARCAGRQGGHRDRVPDAPAHWRDAWAERFVCVGRCSAAYRENRSGVNVPRCASSRHCRAISRQVFAAIGSRVSAAERSHSAACDRYCRCRVVCACILLTAQFDRARDAAETTGV
jgi:hypothetical protein